MSRIGFDRKIHPYQLQLRICSVPDAAGLQNKSGTTIDFLNGKIIDYHIDEDQINTRITAYTASDNELEELYGFFTLDAVEKFEAMPESEKEPYYTGYFDNASLFYLMIGGDGRILDGKRHYIFSNDPIEKVFAWMRKIKTPSG